MPRQIKSDSSAICETGPDHQRGREDWEVNGQQFEASLGIVGGVEKLPWRPYFAHLAPSADLPELKEGCCC